MKMYKNAMVEELAKNGGWTTIELADGTTRKVRNGELTEVESGAQDLMDDAVAELLVPRETGNRVHADLTQYISTDIRTPSGRKSLDCGDSIAAMLRGKPLHEVYQLVADYLATDVAVLVDRYKHLNPGMARMALGNRLRKVGAQ